MEGRPEFVRSLEDFYDDEANVPASKKVPYLIMLCTDSIDGFDVQNTHPYSLICGQKLGGYKSLFKPFKALLSIEIKRRAPNSQSNIKNKTVPQLQEVLKRFPLDELDKAFVINKEQEYRETLLRDIAAQEDRKREANVTRNDKLRFILCFDNEEIREKYALTQHAFTLAELDGRNSEQKEADFYDLIVEMFNDSELVTRTEVLPNLHDDFAMELPICKGDYTLTRKKAKNLIAQMKPKLLDICQRYEASGNGSNMQESDCESSDSAALKKNGDDRAAFLRFEGSELLYWWHVLDKYQLIQFTTARLTDDNGVNCEKTPPRTAGPPRKKIKSEKSSTGSIDESELVQYVDTMGRNLLTLSDAQYTQEIIGLQNQEFELEMKLIDVVNERKIRLINARLVAVRNMIHTVQQKINKNSTAKSLFDGFDDDSYN